MKYAALILCSFIFGFYVNGVRLDLKFTEFKLNAEKQYTGLLKDKFLQEELLRNEIKRLEEEKENTINNINASYNSLLAKYNSLYSDSRNSNHKDSMSNTSKSSIRPTATCTCRQSSKARQGITEALKVGRDCDLLAEKYNRLLTVYNSYKR